MAADRGSAVLKLLLGIDEGTTAVKVMAFDSDLRPVAEARRPVVSRHPRPGWVEQDGEEILEAVVAAVGEVLRDIDGEVVACGLDHQGESVLAWDAESGVPLSPVVVWQDKRSQPLLDRLGPHAGEIRRRSGLMLDPYFSAGKVAWLLERSPAVARAGDEGRLRMGTLDAFLSDRLGADFATDPSTASRTQLSAIGAPAWDEWLCERFGVPVGVLPAIGDTAGELGALRHARWPVELPLRARVCDQQAALAGSGCVRAGQAKATYGTGVFMLAHMGNRQPDAGTDLIPTVAWRIGGVVEYALDGGVFSAGSLLEWLGRDLGLAPDPDGLAALAGSVDDSGGVRVLPALSGLGAPWWKPRAAGVMAGLTGATRPGHIARAALEAIAWRVADIASALSQHVDLEQLRADGGLSRDRLLMQLQADALGLPVATGLHDATAVGAAALAAVGAGIWDSTLEIAGRLPAGVEVRPRRDGAWRAAEHARWRRFVEATSVL